MFCSPLRSYRCLLKSLVAPVYKTEVLALCHTFILPILNVIYFSVNLVFLSFSVLINWLYAIKRQVEVSLPLVGFAANGGELVTHLKVEVAGSVTAVGWATVLGFFAFQLLYTPTSGGKMFLLWMRSVFFAAV